MIISKLKNNKVVQNCQKLHFLEGPLEAGSTGETPLLSLQQKTKQKTKQVWVSAANFPH